jgi:hypothetical protein
VKKIIALIFASSVLAMWVLASQVWAESDIVDSATRISISGLVAYPQLTFILMAWTVILVIGRYLKTFFGKFLLSSISILLFATAAPIWFESASGSLAILSPLVAEAVGVSDWRSQEQLLTNTFYNHLAADLFVIALISGLISSLVFLWIGLSRQHSRPFATRIDNLPRW